MDFGLLLRQGITMKISLIHASYGRPVLAMMTAWKWAENTSGKHQIEYLLSIDQADNSDYPDSVNWKQDYIKSKVINNAASLCTGDIIVVMSDDFECPNNWDDLIVQATKGKSDWILKTQDGTQPWIITLPIMDRTYYNRFGYVYYSSYTHMFCDTELSAVADLLGKRITSDLLFQHKHYSIKNGIAKDKTSIKADATWNQGEALFMKRAVNNFGIESPMQCQELKDTINWINKKNKKS
jgi:hypothetical protein